MLFDEKPMMEMLEMVLWIIATPMLLFMALLGWASFSDCFRPLCGIEPTQLRAMRC